MDLKNFDAPVAILKRSTGETKIESFSKISDRLNKAADEIEREAKKLDQAMARVGPETSKLEKEFRKFYTQIAEATHCGDETAEIMQHMASSMRDLTKIYARELRDATETMSALQDMYSTLAKAIDKAEKSGKTGDKTKAEIAAKAYEKACKASESKLSIIGTTGKFAQTTIEKSAQSLKNKYLSSAETMDRIVTRMTNYFLQDGKDASGAKGELAKAKTDLAWVKQLSK